VQRLLGIRLPKARRIVQREGGLSAGFDLVGSPALALFRHAAYIPVSPLRPRRKFALSMVSSRPSQVQTARMPGVRILIVEGRFYDHINDELVAGAREAVEAVGGTVDVVTVPGALEIPIAIAIGLDGAAAAGRPYDGAVALGCVIRGETYHFDIVAGESSRALMDMGVQRKLPLGNGILTVETEQQAIVRANRGDMNKGGGAAEACLALIRLKRQAGAA
jgi:6,7-dimethyl-8-ribityllumazine synthase